MIGETIAHYQITAHIGAGGMLSRDAGVSSQACATWQAKSAAGGGESQC